jgi:hypothetical protein
VQRQFDRINATLEMRREAMQDEIVANMLAGYAYVNRLLEQDINPLHPKQLHHFLELNNIVLCGCDNQARLDYQGYLEATKHRFYRQAHFSIANIRAWAEKHHPTFGFHIMKVIIDRFYYVMGLLKAYCEE